MKRLLMAAAVVITVGACGAAETEGEAETAVAADTLTRAQKDSIIADLPIPGASGIGAARQAVDRANARVQQHDTIR